MNEYPLSCSLSPFITILYPWIDSHEISREKGRFQPYRRLARTVNRLIRNRCLLPKKLLSQSQFISVFNNWKFLRKRSWMSIHRCPMVGEGAWLSRFFGTKLQLFSQIGKRHFVEETKLHNISKNQRGGQWCRWRTSRSIKKKTTFFRRKSGTWGRCWPSEKSIVVWCRKFE